MEIRITINAERVPDFGNRWKATVYLVAGTDGSSLGVGFLPSGHYEILHDYGTTEEEAQTRAFTAFHSRLLGAFDSPGS